jgi:hypothetical protein
VLSVVLVRFDRCPPLLGPRNRQVTWRPSRIHPPVEAAAALEFLIPEKLRLDPQTSPWSRSSQD